ncbi:VOC family protein [Mycobacterium camsae]|uniref:VOC family protein n=1 Tax=Mycobacterium gordonae TaxID=1778 RepID=UPI00197FAE9D|nr:VOC family protein [Mycobacterium gordonae]
MSHTIAARPRPRLHGPRPGEHPGRAANPVIKVHDIAWLEFEKPDLERTEAFATAFGLTVATRLPDTLVLRASNPGPACLVIRRGHQSCLRAVAFTAEDDADLITLARATGRWMHRLPEHLGGLAVDLTDPNGLTVRVAAATRTLHALPTPTPHTPNAAHLAPRINTTHRPPQQPAAIQRLGHLALHTTTHHSTLTWYLNTLGMIVSDFLYPPDHRQNGPTTSFLRCDRGMTPTDHHTLTLTQAPTNTYHHSAYHVSDLDTIATGGQHLTEHGYQHAWGIGRHLHGSHLFNYWRDPDGLLLEHIADQDMFDCSLEPTWTPSATPTPTQWGPPPTKNYTTTNRKSLPRQALSAIITPRTTNRPHHATRPTTP